MAALVEAYPGLTPRDYWNLMPDEHNALVRRANLRKQQA